MRRSNLNRWFGSRRLGLDWGGSGGEVTGLSGSAPWPPVELASKRTGARRPMISSSKRSGGQGDPYSRVLDGGFGS
jgi:hypothetical protein